MFLLFMQKAGFDLCELLSSPEYVLSTLGLCPEMAEELEELGTKECSFFSTLSLCLLCLERSLCCVAPSLCPG